ncbi:hypothetical protein HDA40_008156 [Hamadaea flava]|nr:hypothetical protein [Hamadaea flava]
MRRPDEVLVQLIADWRRHARLLKRDDADITADDVGVDVVRVPLAKVAPVSCARRGAVISD